MGCGSRKTQRGRSSQPTVASVSVSEGDGEYSSCPRFPQRLSTVFVFLWARTTAVLLGKVFVGPPAWKTTGGGLSTAKPQKSVRAICVPGHCPRKHLEGGGGSAAGAVGLQALLLHDMVRREELQLDTVRPGPVPGTGQWEGSISSMGAANTPRGHWGNIRRSPIVWIRKGDACFH